MSTTVVLVSRSTSCSEYQASGLTNQPSRSSSERRYVFESGGRPKATPGWRPGGADFAAAARVPNLFSVARPVSEARAAGYWQAMSRENVDVVRGIYDAVARRDVVAPFEVYAEDIVWDLSNARRAALNPKP